MTLATTLAISAGMSFLSDFAGHRRGRRREDVHGVALRGAYRSPGETPRARSLGRYTLPPRRRVDEQHPPRSGAMDAVHSLTPIAPTGFLCSHPCCGKGGLTGQARHVEHHRALEIRGTTLAP